MASAVSSQPPPRGGNVAVNAPTKNNNNTSTSGSMMKSKNSTAGPATSSAAITDTTNVANFGFDDDDGDDFDPFNISNKKKSSNSDSNNNNNESLNGGEMTTGTTKSSQNISNNKENTIAPSIGTKTTGGGVVIAPNNATSTSSATTTSSSTALPPKIVVKFSLQEEVMSSPTLDSDNEGSSHVFVQGSLHAQVTSSNALKNSPFVLVGTGQPGTQLRYTPNHVYSKIHGGGGDDDDDAGIGVGGGKDETSPATNKNAASSSSSLVNVVKIPKSILTFVKIGTYTIKEDIDHMPLLLERKVSKVKSYIHVAIQVRSKLSNRSDLRNFSIALAVPTQVDGSTIEIISGDATYDELKRSITWTRSNLPMGASFMVSTRFKLDGDNDEQVLQNLNIDDMKFPVMMRCSSQDQISSAQFQALEASGHPASVTYLTQKKSFRIIHRLK